MGIATLNSNAYVLGITKEKIIQDIYKSVYNRVVNNVTDPTPSARTKWWYPAFPDEDIDTTSNYPLGVINSPELVWSKATITSKYATAMVSLEIYSTKSNQLDALADQVANAMEISRATFTNENLRFVNLDSTDTSMIMRDEIKLHIKTLTFTLRYRFEKSS
jgi:hypothetical protein